MSRLRRCRQQRKISTLSQFLYTPASLSISFPAVTYLIKNGPCHAGIRSVTSGHTLQCHAVSGENQYSHVLVPRCNYRVSVTCYSVTLWTTDMEGERSPTVLRLVLFWYRELPYSNLEASTSSGRCDQHGWALTSTHGDSRRTSARLSFVQITTWSSRDHHVTTNVEVVS